MDKFCFNCKNCTYDEDEDKYYCDLFGTKVNPADHCDHWEEIKRGFEKLNVKQLENLVNKFVEAIKNGSAYFCENCGLLTEYAIRREITEIEIRDAFTDETKHIRTGDGDEEIECYECGREILELDDIYEAYEYLKDFLSKNPQATVEKGVLENLKKLLPQCPNCKSKNIDQRCYDRAGEKEYYHCANCGVWFDEKGVVELEKVRC